MARPLRIEFPGALYHVTSRGDRQESIFEDTKDRYAFLRILAEVIERFNWLCHGYCLMTNHYHLIIETPDANLSAGMRQLNGVYTQASNHKYQRTGHLFQGRFKSIVVDGDSYLKELTRYVVLNPVRAGLVERAEQWSWSSHQAIIGHTQIPAWLCTDVLLSQFGHTRRQAIYNYRHFVMAGSNKSDFWNGLRQQIYLGDEHFIARVQSEQHTGYEPLDTPKRQRRAPAPSLVDIAAAHTTRDDAIAAAYDTGAYSYREIASFYGLHLSTIGRIVRSR